MLLAAGLPTGAIEIPIIAYILNAPPEVMSVTLLDDIGNPTASVDPGVAVTVSVVCRDSNTAADILGIRAVLFSAQSTEGASDSPRDHYTLTWSPSQGFGGSGIRSSACRAPGDLDGAEGTWRFSILLDRSALAGTGWRAAVIVEDEAESDRMVITFAVNDFESASLTSNSISFAGEPGSEAVSTLSLYYQANHAIEIGARSTAFVGREVPSFTLEPEDFSIDDDGDSGVPESGRPKLGLSSTRQVFADQLEGSGQIDIYVFVSIPDPFLDQDYEGMIVFDTRPM